MAHQHTSSSHSPQHPGDLKHEPMAHGYGHEAPHGVGHVVSPKILIATASALLVLTIVTVFAAKIDFSQFDMQEMNIFVALAIAVLKASLVCLFFMHLRWDRPFNAFVLVGSLALVALFIGFAMTDSAEYQRELVPGESELIQGKMADVEKATVEAPAGAPGNAPTTPEASH